MVAQTVYNTCKTMNAVLKAIRPQIGMGTWSFVSGPMTPNLVSSGTDGIVSNITLPGTYRFRWTVSNPPCGTQSSVQVEVNREEPLDETVPSGSQSGIMQYDDHNFDGGDTGSCAFKWSMALSIRPVCNGVP